MAETEKTKTEAESVAAMALSIGQVRKISDSPFVIVPEETKVVELENLLPAPLRKKGKTFVYDLNSFARYIQDYGHPERTAIFSGLTYPLEDGSCAPEYFIEAILDFHQKETGEAGWCQHRVVYILRESFEFSSWKEKNDLKTSQKNFALFMEDRIDDVVDPPGIKFLEMIKSLQATQTQRCNSIINTDTGDVRFEFDKTTVSRAPGEVEIPKRLRIAIPVFDGCEKIAFDVKIRHELKDGNLVFSFEFFNFHASVRDAIKRVYESIESKTKMKPFIGNTVHEINESE